MADFLAYLQKVDASGTLKDKAVSLNDTAKGVLYASAKGLEAKGKIKNIYTEDYPEMDGVRTFHPSDVGDTTKRSTTTVELGVIFTGENRRTEMNNLYEMLRSSRVYFWDSVREKLALLMLEDAVDTEEDVVKGNKFIRVTFKMTNIWGHTRHLPASSLSTYFKLK